MQQQSTLKTLWRFIRPEPEELILYTMVIIAVSSLALYQVAVQGRAGVESQDVLATLATAKDTLLAYLSQDDSWGRFFLFGLWFLIGTVVYILSWALVTILIDINRDIKVSSSFVHPKSFHQSDYWTSIIARWLLRISGGIALLFYSIFWVVGFTPLWLDSLESLLIGGVTGQEIVHALSAVVSIAVTLHIAAILFRIALLRTHYSFES